MLTVKFVLGNDVLEEAVARSNRRLDYYEIAMTLLYSGTTYQQKSINYMMQNYIGKRRTREIKDFIDIQIELGMIEV